MPSAPPPPPAPVVETLTSAADLDQATALYRDVFGYTDQRQGASPRLLTALRSNGGSVVGARGAHGRIVAFAYGFLGTDGRSTYHYSQAAVVDAAYQGRGLGRALKAAQREVALSWGTTRMRWTYDPLLARNAHFNLDVLGAVGRWFSPGYYGDGTDRVTVDWDLVPEPGPRTAPASPPDAAATAWGRPIEDGSRVWIPVPADTAALQRTDPGAAAEARRATAATLGELTADGWAAVSCTVRGSGTALYRLERC
ncbi:GNAT family N-acetyltransferase [Nocardiopsis coralliicola]